MKKSRGKFLSRFLHRASASKLLYFLLDPGIRANRFRIYPQIFWIMMKFTPPKVSLFFENAYIPGFLYFRKNKMRLPWVSPTSSTGSLSGF